MASRRKDVFPQFMSFSVAQTVANTFRSQRIELPVARRPGAKKITVIEVLQVWLERAGETFATGDDARINLQFRDSTVDNTLSNPNVFFRAIITTIVTTSGATQTEEPVIIRYDSGGGKGFLIGTDSIFVTIDSASQGGTVTAHFKILYRFVEVGLQEYIGLVQQQSSQT